MHPHQHRPATGWTREDLLRALDDARSLADQWAERTRVEVDHWTDLDPHGKTERGIELMQAAIQRQPSAPGRPTTKPNDLPQAPWSTAGRLVAGSGRCGRGLEVVVTKVYGNDR